MKKIFFSLLSAILFMAANAQTPSIVNDKNAEVRTVAAFHGVNIGSGIDLYISQGNEDAVAISASDADTRNRIKTEVENGILKIYIQWNAGIHLTWSDKHMKAYVTIKDVDQIKASGGSDVYVEGTIKSNSLAVGASGGSDIYGVYDATNLSFDLSGGSDAKVSGKVTTLSVEASGGSDFHGYDLVAESCSVNASGGSDTYVTANKELNIKASGGSDVTYKGNATIRSTDTSGGSDVKKS